jgi:DNA modification methylase
MQPGLSGGGFAEQYEMMCVFIKGHATQNEYCGNVWQISREHDKRSESEHPHKKPIALLGKALNLCSHEGDIILDLFGGSGSTLIACEQLNRKCRMMELDPHYCTVIIARWEKLTGQKAIKLNE